MGMRHSKSQGGHCWPGQLSQAQWDEASENEREFHADFSQPRLFCMTFVIIARHDAHTFTFLLEIFGSLDDELVVSFFSLHPLTCVDN